MKPLVSILIPAYNAGRWLGETLHSALAQTWERKEIIVVDDGSNDDTLQIAQRLNSDSVRVFTQTNRGAAATRNRALQLSKGEYIQWLDADDLLAPDKIERQLKSVRGSEDRRILLSSSWAHFNYRVHHARFSPTPLWQDLSPVEWLLRKMGQNLYMQTATWLTSRELTEAAGLWDTRLLSDDDGEYFCRVLLASQGTLFVPDSKVFYRITPSARLSHIGASDRKKDAMLIGMKLHVQYLRSLEDSDRAKSACMTYLQTWYPHFYPEREDIVAELQNMAREMRGQLKEPKLRWKYAWMKPLFGWGTAKRAQTALPQLKASCIRNCDRCLYQFEALWKPRSNRLTHCVL
jgi:GT2 family glycosyltransferase